MEGKTQTSSRNSVEKEGEEKGVEGPMRRPVILGDLLWIKIHGSSWWPAQVVDEDAVSESNKPSKRSEGEILVRLYGSYEYAYVNAHTSSLEFEKILVENNGNCNEILRKALEQVIKTERSRKQVLKSKDATLKRTKAKGPKKPEKVTSNKRIQEVQKEIDSNSPRNLRSSPQRSPAASIVRMKGKNDNSHPEKSQEREGKSKRHKLDEEQKKVEPSTPKAATTSVDRSREPSERRVKVMERLGLIPPSGSPFSRNGLHSPTSAVC